MATVLRRARTVGAPGWPGSDSSDHHAAPPNAGHPPHPDLDPEVHLPWRTATVHAGHHRHHRATHRAAHRRRGLAATALRRDAAALAGTIYAAARWAGAFRFRRGVCTDVGAVPGVLGGGLPVGLSGRLPVDVDPRGPPREHRRGNQRVGFGCGRGAFGGVCDRPPHRPVQRRRRGMGLGFRRRRRRRRDARPRRPGSPMAATSVGVDLGSAAELAHVPQDSRSGGGSPLRRPAARCHACAGIAQGLRITGPPDVVRLIPDAAFRSHRADAEAVTGCWGAWA